MNYLELAHLLAPELIVVLTALAVISLGTAIERGALAQGWRNHLWLAAAAGLVVAGAVLATLPQPGIIADGMLTADPLAHGFKGLLLVLSLLTLPLAAARPDREHLGEFLGLILLATVGFLLAVASQDLLMIFLSLEMAALPLYILTGFDRRRAESVEAALKVFLFGGVSSAFMLFGLSLIYGYTHATRLPDIAAALATTPLEPMLAVGVVMTLAGFAFKIAAAPFHLWAPDTYEGATLPAAALFSASSKVVGFFLLGKTLYFALGPLHGSANWGAFAPGWVPLVVLLAALSMTLGNLGALAQRRSVRRLLAYSAIAHGGYLLLGLGAATPEGLSAALFYVIIYAITALGAFGVVALVRHQRGGDRPEDFAGLARQSPGLAFCLLLFLLSLAGIPPLAGFIGKFSLFLAALKSAQGLATGGGLFWVVALGIALNAVSLYYYLLLAKQAWLRPAHAALTTPSAPLLPARLAVAACAIALVLLGLFPNLLMHPLAKALAALTLP